MKRTLLAATPLLLLWAAPIHAGVPGPLTPEAIMGAEEHLNFSGVLLINQKQRVRVTHASGQRQRKEFLDAQGRLVDLVVSDGQIRWHHTPASRVVKIQPLEPHTSLKQRVALMRRNYQFSVMGQTRAANRIVLLTQFRPVHRGHPTHRLWVDLETRLPLVVERRSATGALIDRSEYTQIAYQPRPAPNLFSFRIPEGCRVHSPLTVLARGDGATPPPRGVAFQPAAPRALPGGYALLHWQYFQSAKQVPTFTWRYHDGLNLLSVFAVDARHRPAIPAEARAITLGGLSAYSLVHGPDHMLMWHARGLAYTLVGLAPEQELAALARSTL